MTVTSGSRWRTPPRPCSWRRSTGRSSSSRCRPSSAASTWTRWRAGNISYLLWMIMGYRLVQAVLVVTVGRLGDMFGRVRIYNAGFVVFTVASILLSFDPFDGGRGALWLIGWRVLQAVGGSMLMANSAAILTDAFPADQRGFALGTNQIAGLAGMFVGLVAGGLLAAIDWRAVFWVNVPVGIYGTVWAYRELRDNGERHRGPHRLVGQHHLRRRAGRGPDRRHLRHPAVRRAHDGLDESVGARRAGRRRSPCWSCSASSRPGSPSRCSSSACSASGPSRPVTWRAWRCRSPGAACSSCSSSGCRASGCRCTATTTATPRCGRASSCCP